MTAYLPDVFRPEGRSHDETDNAKARPRFRPEHEEKDRRPPGDRSRSGVRRGGVRGAGGVTGDREGTTDGEATTGSGGEVAAGARGKGTINLPELLT